jgi:hypothetical protein
MMQRFLKATSLLNKGDVVCNRKSSAQWEFTVKGKYTVIVKANYVSCSCEYGSLHGVNKSLPCSHVLAVFGSMMHLFGPVLRQRWCNPLIKCQDWYDLLTEEEKECFDKRLIQCKKRLQ